MNQELKSEILSSLKIGEYHSQCSRDKLVTGSPIWQVMNKQVESILSTIKQVEDIEDLK